MKIGNVAKLPILICITIIVSMANTSLTIGDNRPVSPSERHLPELVPASGRAEIADNFSTLSYKPVSDTCPYVGDGGKLSDNFLYKEWCEETFVNGDSIYEAYKDIAFNIKYTPETGKTDFWQTPVETARLRKGDCEDAVFLFFSQLPSDQKNAEIVWGWVINRQSTVGRAHVWYQLSDKRGQQYVVEGFSNDWNGIIPMRIIEETESRRPILTMTHSAVGKLSGLLSEADDQQIYQSLIDLLAAADSIDHNSGNQLFLQDTNTLPSHSNYEYIACSTNMQGKSREYTTYRGYPIGRKMLPDVNKEISNILKKLHELFSRCEKEKKETGMQVAHSDNPFERHPPERRCRAGSRAGTIEFYREGDFRCKR